MTLDSILDSFYAALNRGADNYLSLAVINNMLYAIYLFDQSHKVLREKGRKLLDMMDSLGPIDRWTPNYLDTAGCIHYRLALYDQESAVEHLEKAKHFCECCLQKATDWLVPLRRQKLYQDNLNLVMEELHAQKNS